MLFCCCICWCWGTCRHCDCCCDSCCCCWGCSWGFCSLNDWVRWICCLRSSDWPWPWIVLSGMFWRYGCCWNWGCTCCKIWLDRSGAARPDMFCGCWNCSIVDDTCFVGSWKAAVAIAWYMSGCRPRKEASSLGCIQGFTPSPPKFNDWKPGFAVSRSHMRELVRSSSLPPTDKHHRKGYWP